MLVVMEMEAQEVCGNEEVRVLGNPTVRLMHAESMDFRENRQDGKITVTLRGILTDWIPFYPDVRGDERNGLSDAPGAIFKYGPGYLIRINGKQMTIKEAATKYPSGIGVRVQPVQQEHAP